LTPIVHRLQWIPLAAVAVLLAAACGNTPGGGASPGTFKGTKKIGMSMGITGQSQLYGKAIKAAAELWQEETNKAGGVNGYKIEVVIRDDGSEVARATENTRQLILEEKVVALIGDVLSSQCQGAMPLAKQNQVLYIAATCNDYRNTTSPDYRIPQYVSVVPNTYMEATAAGIDAGQKTNLKKWYILSPDYAFGKAETPAFVAALKKANPSVQIVNAESEWYIPNNTFDFSTILPKIQAKQPDAIYSNIFADTQVAFINKALQTDPTFFSRYYFTTLSSIDEYTTLGDKYPLGVRVYERAPFFGIQGEAVKTFVKNFKNKHNFYPSDWAVMDYDALSIWATAAKKANSFDTDKVLKQISGQTFDTLRGRLTIRAEDLQADAAVWVGTTTSSNGQYPFVILKDVKNPPGKDLLIPLDKVKAMQDGKCPKNDLNNCP
jgi:branched-chain amino acid transport system substrate-binding protein